MKKVLPIILTGSLIFFYNVFRSYLTFLPDLSPIANFSFGLLAIFVAFFITHEAMLKLGHGEYQINASLISVASYLMPVSYTHLGIVYVSSGKEETIFSRP